MILEEFVPTGLEARLYGRQDACRHKSAAINVAADSAVLSEILDTVQ